MQASLILQRALHAALAADTMLQARSIRIFDAPPADAPPPYISIGADEVRDWGWKGGGGWEHRFAIRLWDQPGSFGTMKAVMADVERAVRTMPRQYPGLRIVSLSLAEAKVRPNRKTWTEGVIAFRARTVMEN
ncbi:MAG: DUF3168 domain-containing protein [Thermaurantiacus sp.]